jgi:hypothetical protein
MKWSNTQRAEPGQRGTDQPDSPKSDSEPDVLTRLAQLVAEVLARRWHEERRRVLQRRDPGESSDC